MPRDPCSSELSGYLHGKVKRFLAVGQAERPYASFFFTGLSQSRLGGQERQAETRRCHAEAGAAVSDMPREGTLGLDYSAT